VEALQKAHFLVLPTHGENFGHAIFEALAMGRPVIISDETPWKNLYDRQLGWDISLHQPGLFAEAIRLACMMGQEDYDQWSQRAFRFARQHVDSLHLKEQYVGLFTQEDQERA
jgi:glycosyltransferase involved in cell wall biosynthesis